MDVGEGRGGPTKDREVGARPTWIAVAMAGGLLVLLQLALPDSWPGEVLYVAVGVAAVAAISVAVRRCGLARPRAWTLLALGVGTTVVGDGIWVVYDLRGLDPFPSIADVAYLAAYPLLAASLWRFSSRDAGRRGALHDAAIVAVAGVVVGWVFLLAPYADDPTLSAAERVFSLAYPVGDLLILLLVARLLFDHGARLTTHLFVLAGMGLHLTADVVFALGVLGGWYGGGGPIDSLWLVGYVCFATAAWHPTATIEPRDVALGPVASAVAARSAMLSQWRLAILAFASVLAPGIILVYGHRDPVTVRIAAGGAILLALLVLHRMAGLTARIGELVTDLDRLSNTDPLTGAANRRQLDQRLDTEVARSDRSGAPLSLAVFDLDHFKRYNDAYGHQAGDTMLRDLVENWHRELRAADLLARFGGEEFVVVFVDCPPEDAEVATERLRGAVPRGETCSAGVAHRRPGEDVESLVRRADRALYEAKRSGRDRSVVADADAQSNAVAPKPAAG